MRVIAALMLTMILNGYAFGQSKDSAVPCVADAKWLNTNGSVNYSRQSQIPVSISLMAHVSKGGGCSNAEIRLTATYLTDTQDFICSGTVPQVAIMTTEAQSFNLEVRPFTQLDFVRWRNQPGIRGLQQGKRLNCSNIDGTSELGDTDRSKAAWVRLSVAVLPSSGGLAVIEALIHINP